MIGIVQQKILNNYTEEELKTYLENGDYFVSRQSLRNILKENANPTLNTLVQLAGCLDMHISELFKE